MTARKIDYKTVDALKKFKLGHAANLWAGIDPQKAGTIPIVSSPESAIADDQTASPVVTIIPQPEVPQNSWVFLQVLKDAMRDGELPPPPDGKITKTTLVSRDALILWAKKMRSEQDWPLPPFLFPEERPSNALALAKAEGECRDWLIDFDGFGAEEETKKRVSEGGTRTISLQQASIRSGLGGCR